MFAKQNTEIRVRVLISVECSAEIKRGRHNEKRLMKKEFAAEDTFLRASSKRIKRKLFKNEELQPGLKTL